MFELCVNQLFFFIELHNMYLHGEMYCYISCLEYAMKIIIIFTEKIKNPMFPEVNKYSVSLVDYIMTDQKFQ